MQYTAPLALGLKILIVFEADKASIWEADPQLHLELRKKPLTKGRHLVLSHQCYKDLVKVSFLKVWGRFKYNYIFIRIRSLSILYCDLLAPNRYRRNDDEGRNGNMLQLRDDRLCGLSGRGINPARFPLDRPTVIPCSVPFTQSNESWRRKWNAKYFCT